MRACDADRATPTTPIARLAVISRALSALEVAVCIAEVQLFCRRQLFELALHSRLPLFCAVTAANLPTVLLCGRCLTRVGSEIAMVAVRAAFVDTDADVLAPFVHPHELRRLVEAAVLAGRTGSFDEMDNTRMRALLPPRTTSHPTLSNHDFCTVRGQMVQAGVRLMAIAAPQFSGLGACVRVAVKIASDHTSHKSTAHNRTEWPPGRSHVAAALSTSPTTVLSATRHSPIRPHPERTGFAPHVEQTDWTTAV
jgi:hypothetical protein